MFEFPLEDAGMYYMEEPSLLRQCCAKNPNHNPVDVVNICSYLQLDCIHLQMASKPYTYPHLNCIGFVEGSTVSANQALLSDLEVLDGGYLAMSGRINGAALPHYWE